MPVLLLTLQVLPTDVDYKVLLTFLEFYLTLLQFINFKLYHTIGVSLQQWCHSGCLLS
jgi:hypothetical protein